MTERRLILGVILGMALIGITAAARLWPQNQPVAYKDITSTELKEMLQSKDFWLVNVHVPYEGEIEATDAFVGYDEIDKNLDKLPNKDARIVLYCRSGRMSEIAAKKLVELGYTNVYNLLLGMHDWQANGYPLKD